MIVGIDLDGVIYYWDSVARFLLEEQFDLEPLEKPRYWDHIKDQVAPEQWEWLWKEGIEKGLFRHGHLFKGSIEALNELQHYADIAVITHRPSNAKLDTIAWLAFHQLPVNRVIMLHNGEPKSTQACDVYVDDNADICIELSESTDAVVCLWRRPWNEHLQPTSRITVIDKWGDLLDIVKGLAA